MASQEIDGICAHLNPCTGECNRNKFVLVNSSAKPVGRCDAAQVKGSFLTPKVATAQSACVDYQQGNRITKRR